MERGDRELSIRETVVENNSVDLEVRIFEECVFPYETRKNILEFLIGKFLIPNFTVTTSWSITSLVIKSQCPDVLCQLYLLY